MQDSENANTGRYDAVLRFLEEKLQLQKTSLGVDHDKTLDTADALALSYGITGQNDKAIALFKETLHLRETKLGNSHIDTLTSMKNLAMIYCNAGQHDRALPIYQELASHFVQARGPEHPSTKWALQRLDECRKFAS